MLAINLSHYLIIAAALFCTGIFLCLTKRNTIAILIGIELMLNAANLNLVAFSQYDPTKLQGATSALFVMVVAAAETAVALAIIINTYQYYQTIDPQKINSLKN